MKAIVLVHLLVAASCQVFKKELDDDWRKFKEIYNKKYMPQEESKKRWAFESNIEKVVKHNREYDMGLHTHRLGINQYSDMTNEEFMQRMTGYRMRIAQSVNLFTPTGRDLPDTVDWREKGIVTPVKNQGMCGSCWAFATVSVLESQYALATGRKVNLSVQNLMDCSELQGNRGCCGGEVTSAFDYIIKNGGIATAESYPYTEEIQDPAFLVPDTWLDSLNTMTSISKVDECTFKPDNIGATMRDYKNIPFGDEAALKEAVATIGPIAVGLDSRDLGLYKDGVYYNANCSSTDLNHAVLVVGYGIEDGKDYWLIKNSWGTMRSGEGYVKISRNRNNHCGIASNASYPIV